MIDIITNSNASSMRALTGFWQDAEITYPLPNVPVVQGAKGRAWVCDIAAGLRELGRAPEEDAALDHWLVEAPWAHPAWHSYSIILIHLRPMPDGRATEIYLDGATHELWLYALNPDVPRNELLRTGMVGKKQWLVPGNFSAQFIEISDELARERVKRTVQEICDGKLSPDVDFLSEWIRRFGSNMIRG